MPPKLLDIYRKLYDHFGPQNWWPGDTAFEIMVGAVLTQNTSWRNVKKAIDNLKSAQLLSLSAMMQTPPGILAEHIRPSGYYNLKTKRLLNLLHHIREHYQADLDAFFSLPMDILRSDLLGIKGIGPETADSIMLYAAAKPVFVVDAYTHRILLRHGIICEEADYHEIQELFMDSLPEDMEVYNEYHALIVRTGKEFCKKTNPRCDACPLAPSADI